MDIQRDGTAYTEAAKTVREKMAAFGSDEYITDVLVQYLFGEKKATHKAILWDCYGAQIYQNLVNNKAGVQKMCSRCGERFTPLYPHQCLCRRCAEEGQRIPEEIPEAYCIDCGRLFQPNSLKQTRCPVCQWLADNAPVLAGPGEVIERCEVCGSEFPVRAKGRGKRRRVCDRCRDESRRELSRNRTIRFRKKKSVN